MPLRHAGICMAEVRGDYQKRGASLQKVRGVGVSQNVETGRRLYNRASASLAKLFVAQQTPPQQRWAVYAGRVDIGGVVAVLSGVSRLTDPWGDLFNYFRELNNAHVKYGLVRDAIFSTDRSLLAGAIA